MSKTLKYDISSTLRRTGISPAVWFKMHTVYRGQVNDDEFLRNAYNYLVVNKKRIQYVLKVSYLFSYNVSYMCFKCVLDVFIMCLSCVSNVLQMCL